MCHNLKLVVPEKTPQIEYLIDYCLKTSAWVLRKSEGFLFDASSNAEILGDEPFQFFIQQNIQVR
jgi:tetraacyldisaccharide 4'-kinase